MTTGVANFCAWKEMRVELRLSPEREGFVRQAVESGQYTHASAVVEAALGLLMAQGARGAVLRAVALGLEQAAAGRSAALSLDDVLRRAHRKPSRP